MTGGPRHTLPRWLLLCLVLLGLVTMHHVANQHSEHTGSPATFQQVAAEHDGAAPGESPSHGSSSLLGHLCLAVLAGSIVLLLTVWFARRFPDPGARIRPRAGHPGAGRSPPGPVPIRTGFAYDLCVLRL